VKAPLQKSNDTIQIVVTTACNLYRCSNCTQLLPFRKDYKHMTVDCFAKAVDSVVDWPGVVGLFGGNPCSHPRFEDLCAILEEKIPDQRRRGIWTNDLLGKGAVVRRTFYPNGRFNINVHGKVKIAQEIEDWLPGKVIPSSVKRLPMHSSILVTWRDMSLTRDEWAVKREACDINRNWSSAIVERDGEPYAYFCEVAAALDGIRDMNLGIPTVPGWWKNSMDGFPGQVEGCCDAGCGIPLRMKGHASLENTYDMSGEWLADQDTPIGIKLLSVGNDEGATCVEATDYMRIRDRG
jgi:hypothetical protein